MESSVVRGEEALLARAKALTARGVDWLDLGGRSITPDAPKIDDAEEQARLEPAMRLLRDRGYRISVDTWSPETAVRSLAWGAGFVNYTRQELPDELLEAVAHAGAVLSIAYMPHGDAYRLRDASRTPAPAHAVREFLRPRVERARKAGVREIVVDPNLGILHPETDPFQKIHLQHHLLWNLDVLRELDCRILLYAARKPEPMARIMMASAVLHARPDYVRTHEPEILDSLEQAALDTRTQTEMEK